MRPQPMMKKEYSTQDVLQQAISLLERIYDGNPPPGQLSFFPPSHAKLALRLVLRSVITKQNPTALITESFYCDQAAMHMILMRSHIDAQEVIDKKIDSWGFDRMTQAAYELAHSPLFFLATEATIMQHTTQRILHLIENCGLQTVVAEIGSPWKSIQWEENLKFISEMTQVSVHLFFPPY